MGLVPEGWGEVLDTLDARQRQAEQAHLAARAGQLTHELPDAYCLRDFCVLDVDAGALRDDSTVRIENGLIDAVGATDAIDCNGLVRIEGNGRTLIPGLWDMHVHIGPSQGALHIAAGVTTIRDLANTHDRLIETIEQSKKVRRSDRGSIAPGLSIRPDRLPRPAAIHRSLGIRPLADSVEVP